MIHERIAVGSCSSCGAKPDDNICFWRRRGRKRWRGRRYRLRGLRGKHALGGLGLAKPDRLRGEGGRVDQLRQRQNGRRLLRGQRLGG